MRKKADFKIIYRQYFEQIFRFCYRFLDSQECSLDIAQETFIRMFERMIHNETKIENPKAWLYKVAGNLCLNELKKSSRHREIKSGIEQQTICELTPENVMIEDEDKMQLRKALNQLSPRNRIIVLMYQDGMSYKEISDACEININSVGKTLWRAIEKISEAVKY